MLLYISLGAFVPSWASACLGPPRTRIAAKRARAEAVVPTRVLMSTEEEEEEGVLTVRLPGPE